MRKFVVFLLVLMPVIGFAQSKEIKAKIDEYERNNFYTVDGRNIVVTAVIENIQGNKDDIYVKVKNYFARVYMDANSVIQTDDKTAGVIVGKGYYSEFFSYTANLIIPVTYSTYHVLRVDVKDGRVRIICSANEYIAEWSTVGNNYKKETYPVIACYPFTDKRVYSNKGKTAEAFIALVDRMHMTINNLEKALTEGIVSGENDDW